MSIRVKPSLQKLYDKISIEIEEMRKNTLKSKGSITKEEEEEEEVKLSQKESREFRSLVFELLGK